MSPLTMILTFTSNLVAASFCLYFTNSHQWNNQWTDSSLVTETSLCFLFWNDLLYSKGKQVDSFKWSHLTSCTKCLGEKWITAKDNYLHFVCNNLKVTEMLLVRNWVLWIFYVMYSFISPVGTDRMLESKINNEK